jgi:hypothetical protein
MPRRTRIARAVVALVAAAACLAVTAWPCRPRPPDLSGLDEPGLSWCLEALGYRVHEEPADREGADERPVCRGLYFARRDVTDSWEEVASRPRRGAASWPADGCPASTSTTRTRWRSARSRSTATRPNWIGSPGAGAVALSRTPA